jgi:hypothetical protein
MEEPAQKALVAILEMIGNSQAGDSAVAALVVQITNSASLWLK